jgi:hypothetical protein
MPKLLLRHTDLLETMEGPAEARTLLLHRLDYAGALHDPLAVSVFCQPRGVDISIVNVEMVLQDEYLLTLDLGSVTERQDRISRQLLLRE